MAINRIQRINDIIRREMGNALYHVGQNESINPIEISFVEAETSPDLRSCMIHVSFLAPPEKHAALLSWLKKHRTEFQSYIAKHVGLKYTPRLMFKQTNSIEKGDRVLSILSDMKDEEENN